MDLNGFVPHYRHMFAPYCPRHQSRILLGYESVLHVEQTPAGPKVHLRCHCGALLMHDTAPGSAPQTGMPETPAPVNVVARALLPVAGSR